MARRKSLLAQMYAAHQKAKLERERLEEQARKAWLAEERKAAVEEAKEAARQRREAEQAEQAQERAEEQARRLAIQEERARQQREAAQSRERRREEAEARRLAAQRQSAEAEVMTEAVQAKVAAFERLLVDRSSHLSARSRIAEDAFNADGPEALVETIQRALATSVYPDGLDGSCAARYVPEASELWVEYELPRQQVIPVAAAYRYVKSKDAIQPEPRKDAEIKKLYERLITRVALRTLAEAFDVAPVTLVSGIVFNGYVSAKDRATGKPVRPLVLSVQAMRDAFEEIVLDEPELDPKVCLTSAFNALISPHPYDLVPVEPVLKFDLSKYKFVEEMDVIAGLDSRPDLLALTPGEIRAPDPAAL
jgi:restriction system protein